MAGGNSTGDRCSYDALKQCSSQIICNSHSLHLLDKSMRHKMWLVNALLVASAILAGVTVGIGVFGQRYRYHRLTRFIFLGATTLFLPVMSTVVPMVAGSNDYATVGLTAQCKPEFQSPIVIIWASLVQIITINTSAIVAVDDREGRNIGPPFELLVQGAWTLYLGITYLNSTSTARARTQSREALGKFLILTGSEGIPFALTCAKMVFKYYAFKKARRSFALRNNPHLIFAYMQQPPLVQAGTSHRREAAVVTDEDVPPPPPLLVMGEGKRHVEMQSHGYVWKGDSGTAVHGKDGLVTIDSVWKITACFFPSSTLQRLQDLCLSFAFFKLLRCRFARYNVNNNADASSDMFIFFWSLLLKDGDHNRVFQVISDEVSFVHDYYYTSVPISYSKCWLPIVSIFISLLSIAYCIFAAMLISLLFVINYVLLKEGDPAQFTCYILCIEDLLHTEEKQMVYGSWLSGLVPLLLLLVLVSIVEVRDMASYICSNWTKVSLVCCLLNRASSTSSSSKHSLCIQKCAGILLRCRCKLLRRHWDEKIGQCSVLSSARLGLLWHLLFPFLPDQNRKVRVSAAVKVSIIQALRRTRDDGGQLTNGAACLRRRRGQVSETFNWACSNKSTSYTILTWHIATSILEVRYPHLPRHAQEQDSLPLSNTDYKMVATHLSRYCAYLVTWCPELLPDDHEWSSSLYEDVKKDAQHVLAGCTAGDSLTPKAKCQQLVKLLSTKAKHDVVKDGARLGEQLAELVLEDGDDTVWKLLAEFWSEMILYFAPSDNLKGHKQAIARGGELITLLWVLLFHAGIVSRPGEDDSAALPLLLLLLMWFNGVSSYYFSCMY